jgi:PAP_fibrillin
LKTSPAQFSWTLCEALNLISCVFIRRQAAGDLLPEELDDVFEKAPKFPTTEVTPVERIDVDSFVQVYRDIDDLFEDDDEVKDLERTSPEQLVDTAAVGEVEEETTTSLDVESESSLDGELASIYESICDDNGMIGKQQIREWDEVARLMQDGLLGDDELNDLWTSAAGEQQLLDLDGFLSFNVALDNLFDFDDDDMLDDDEEGDMEDIMDDLEEELAEEPKHVIANPPQPKMVSGDDLSPEALFTALANAETGYVSWEDLKRWKELQEMLVEGDLLESELSDLFQQSSQKVSPVPEATKQLDLQAFILLTVALDNLFEENDDEEVTTTGGDETSVTTKDELLDTLASLERDDVLPCGLEATELEQREIRNLVDMVEGMPSNWLLQGTGRTIDAKAVTGTWELAYTSSSAMKFNKGLTGLGGSVPNGRFGRLQQKLMATKYLTDVEYKEHIVLTPASASFDVTVTGTWEVRSSVSLFTGAPSVVLQVVPDRVTYGPTSTRADHWKSLGPMNLLDISYLDEDLRIMRGNTSVDTIFIFRRIK